MDQQEREMLSDQIGLHVGWYVQEQTKHLIEAMPCVCKEMFDKHDGDYIGEEKCNRCNKLKELEKK